MRSYSFSQLLSLLLFAIICTSTCDDGGSATLPAAPVAGVDAPAHGLAWILRDAARAEARDLSGELCASGAAAASAGQDGQTPAAEPPDGPGAGDGAMAPPAAAAASAAPGGAPSASAPATEPSAKGAAEDAIEPRSLFAKIVDLVKTPPAAVPADGVESHNTTLEGGREADSGANASDTGSNATGSGHAGAGESHANEGATRGREGRGRGGAEDSDPLSDDGAAPVADGSPVEIEVDAQADEPEWLLDEMAQPADIGPDIFPEVIPSIRWPDDPCSDKCSINTCSGHGVCSAPLCQCNCTAPYTGRYCHERVTRISHFRVTPPKKPCPDNCTGQGECQRNGTCSCYKGWAGYNCSIECMGGIANPCSGHGVCLQASGKCLCTEGYAGKNCTRRSVPQDFDNYRKMVLLSESKEEEADKGADAGKKSDAAANASAVADAVAASAVANSTDSALGGNASDASNATSKNVSVAASEADKQTETKKAEDKFVKGVEISDARLRRLGVDHAAFDLGGKALATNKEARSASALVKNDKDKYWISPCRVEKGVMWVVLELNEIIHVRTIVIGNFEYYSSTPHKFQVLGQLAYPTDHWNVLGYFEASSSHNRQEFTLKTPMMAKVLKIRLLTHHGNEFYCTMSKVQVYGTTQWEEMGRALEENEQQVEIVKRALDGKEEKEGEKDKENAAADAAASAAAAASEAATGAGGGSIVNNASAPGKMSNGSKISHPSKLSNASKVSNASRVANAAAGKSGNVSKLANASGVPAAHATPASLNLNETDDAAAALPAETAAVAGGDGMGAGEGKGAGGVALGASANVSADGAGTAVVEDGGAASASSAARGAGAEDAASAAGAAGEGGKKAVGGLAAHVEGGVAQKVTLVKTPAASELSVEDAATADAEGQGDGKAAAGTAGAGEGAGAASGASGGSSGEDSSGASIFSKIVDLVTPPSATAPATAAEEAEVEAPQTAAATSTQLSPGADAAEAAPGDAGGAAGGPEGGDARVAGGPDGDAEEFRAADLGQVCTCVGLLHECPCFSLVRLCLGHPPEQYRHALTHAFTRHTSTRSLAHARTHGHTHTHTHTHTHRGVEGRTPQCRIRCLPTRRRTPKFVSR